MKQKKKASESDGMGLVLMGVKKGTFDKTVRIARSKKRKGGRQEEQREN
ncbi:hypothetical protein AGMMS49950_11390 [Endomicrobiia bacterium]|nr:hypothetical protein AGMMS49531_11150 [Endomicrobiia bacterium]GHT72870.1 hypothetical protein AGMMS49950_11390 [Endomicrobiia bacterium]